MSKELEAFNELKNGHWFDDIEKYSSVNPKLKEMLDIIETALKRLEEIDKLPKTVFYATNKIELNNELDKKLKALEIIKNKQVNVHTFLVFCFNRTWEEYCYLYHSYKECNISKEPLFETEYRLLKEVLLCG